MDTIHVSILDKVTLQPVNSVTIRSETTTVEENMNNQTEPLITIAFDDTRTAKASLEAAWRELEDSCDQVCGMAAHFTRNPSPDAWVQVHVPETSSRLDGHLARLRAAFGRIPVRVRVTPYPI